MLLTCDNIETSRYDTRYKMNPPLRESSDIAAIKEGIADGTITVLGTDHAPHTHESKDVPFDTASFGLIGLETAVPLYAKALVDDGVIGWLRLIDMLTWQPAQLCGLDKAGLGRLAVGGPADVTVINPSERWKIDDSCFASKSRNTPFTGWNVSARVEATIVSGMVRLCRRGVSR